MNNHRHFLARAIACAGLLALANVSAAHASLIFDSTIDVSGQGFGNVPRDLTIQATGQNKTGTESGCISALGGVFAGGPASCISDAAVHDANGLTNIGGDEVSPLADDQKFGIPTLGSLGITDAGQILILFNPTEPGGDSANVTDLTLKFYSGNALLAAIDGSQNFSSTDPGNGVAGFVFVVDPVEQNFLDGNIFNQPNFGAFNLALEATISDIDGGPESFVILNRDSTVQVPEPRTLSLFGAGLIGLLALVRRRWQVR